jgi:hypothetical protein
VYYQWIQTNGYKLFSQDARADTADVNATNPGIAYEPSLHFAIAWQAERTPTPVPPATPAHDVYARFFDNVGSPKANPCNGNSTAPVKISASTLDATAPAIASDVNGNQLIAWQESDASTARIMIAKYDTSGCLLVAPTPIVTGSATTIRGGVALALDSQSPQTVIATWWEKASGGYETVFRRRLRADTLAYLDASPVQVDQPPSAPVGVQRAAYPSVATAPAGANANKFVVSWNANVNARDASPLGSTIANGFGRSFAPDGTTLKNDFRVDLSGRNTTGAPAVTRSSQAGKYAYAWRDNRSGHYEVYTRAAPSF